MPRFAYVSGRYVSHKFATVHIEDRGYQFADGVYEVSAIRNGRFIDVDPHLDRLDRSLSELRIPLPMSRRALKIVMHELVRRNRLSHGIIYMQVTRGVAPRDHKFPKSCLPQLVMTTSRLKQQPPDMIENGVSVISMTGFSGGRSAKLAHVNLHVDGDNYGVLEDTHQGLMHILAQFIRQKRMDEDLITERKF